ncbi:hypothetical protein [Mesorhizobium sp.]|uniref:hypothetical protein n=1 Tax=Mesorhizobium sp. TaxID=1871066 RepID=UPI000FE598CF|nr:hypothetical protein [Mesorhizobium sp.]RWD23049.1 MAG: hypothetical protein EOS33_27200 [Mesorhizobium sp.]
MAKAHTRDSISAFECDVIRQAFLRWVAEDNPPEEHRRPAVKHIVRIMSGNETVDPDMLDWIVRKEP